MFGSVHRRLFLKLFGAAAAVAACSTDSEGDEESSEDQLKDGDEFDYIVVGSGAGGGPIAANLAKADFRVLLLEAGSDHGARTTYQVPAFHTQSSEDPNMTWEFFVKHYTDEARQKRDPKFQDFSKSESNKKGVLYPRAATLGGCTAHNAMITCYPHASDWDDVAKLTKDPTWSAPNMRKYFQLVEKCDYMASQPAKDRAGHGFGGWLNTSLGDPSILLKTLDARMIAVVNAAAVAFGVGDSGVTDIAAVASSPSRLAELPRVLRQIFDELVGILTRDLNSAAPERDKTEGLFNIPLAMNKGHRNGTREYILATAAERKNNLFIETEALASRVLFADGKVNGKLQATGVEFLKGAKLYRADRDPAKNPQKAQRIVVKAKREVIISAGAYNTPQLLMLSGIGPKKQIGAEGETIKAEGEARDRGVKVLKNLEGVGTNLQDRYEVGVITSTGKDFSILDNCTFGISQNRSHLSMEMRTGRFGIPIPVPVMAEETVEDPCLTQWKSGTGPYMTNGAVTAVVKRSSVETAESNPDLIIFCLPGAFKGYYRGYSDEVFKKAGGAPDKTRYTWAILKGHTRNSAGTVTLRNANPWDTPEINFRYFDEGTPDGGKDLQAMVDGLDFVRKINEHASPVLSLFGDVKEELPGADVDSATFVKDNAWGHHASCTCPIGEEAKGGVLDTNLVVHGTNNLRIVDASVFPKIPGFFIVTSIYTVSEKATDDVLEAAGRSRRIPRPR
jgi:choline dehydrogenase